MPINYIYSFSWMSKFSWLLLFYIFCRFPFLVLLFLGLICLQRLIQELNLGDSSSLLGPPSAMRYAKVATGRSGLQFKPSHSSWVGEKPFRIWNFHHYMDLKSLYFNGKHVSYLQECLVSSGIVWSTIFYFVLENNILLEHCSNLQKEHLFHKKSTETSRLNYVPNKRRDQGWD